MTDLTHDQLRLARELTMTMLTFDGTHEEFEAHLTSVFADPTLSAEDRAEMPRIVVAAFGQGTFVLQQLRHQPGLEAVDAYLQRVAAEWARVHEESADDSSS